MEKSVFIIREAERDLFFHGAHRPLRGLTFFHCPLLSFSSLLSACASNHVFPDLDLTSTSPREGLDLRRRAPDSHLLPRGPRLPEVDALLVPRGHLQDREPQQREAGRGLAGRVEGVLLCH